MGNTVKVMSISSRWSGLSSCSVACLEGVTLSALDGWTSVNCMGHFYQQMVFCLKTEQLSANIISHYKGVFIVRCLITMVYIV